MGGLPASSRRGNPLKRNIRWLLVTACLLANLQLPAPQLTLAEELPHVYADAAYGSDATGDGSPAAPFATARRAVSELSSGPGYIHLAPGTYTGTLYLAAGQSLLGAGAAQTIIRGTSTTRAIQMGGAGARVVENLTVTGGNFVSGGGVYVQDSELTMRNVVVEENVAEDGAGVYVTGGTLTAESCVVRSNHGPGGDIGSRGAGVCLLSGSVAHIRDSLIEDNRFAATFPKFNVGTTRGAGVFASASTLEIVRSRVAGNEIYATSSAPRPIYGVAFGGGVYAESSAVMLLDSVFTQNECGPWPATYGGAIYAPTSAVTVNGCTIAFNYAPRDNAAETGGTADIAGSIVWSSSIGLTNASVPGSFIQGAVGSLTPSFVATASGDFHLRANSPCIDLAASGTGSDIDGTPRPQGVRHDAGAYEYHHTLDARVLDPVITSPTHAVSVPSNSRTVTLNLAGAWSPSAPLDGYRISLSRDTTEYPEQLMTHAAGTSTCQLQAEVDGTYWVNVATVDVEGNRSAGTHYGPLIIDVPLRLDSLSAYHGPPGTEVSLNGSGFGAIQSTSRVIFAGSTAEVVSWSPTRVVARVPEGAQSGYAGVVVDGATSNGKYFIPFARPAVTGMTPSAGAPGTVVTFVGTGFEAEQGGGRVTFAGTIAEVVSWSDTQVQAMIPTGAVAGYAGIVQHGLTSNGRYFIPSAQPVVSSASVRAAIVGSSVTLTGTGFGSVPGSVIQAGVRFNAETWSDTQVTFTVPPTVRSGYVGVVANGIVSNGKYLAIAPRLTALSSWWRAPGSQMTVYGSGFGATPGAYRVKVNGVEATQVVSWSPEAVTFVVPAGATSGYVGVGTAEAMSNGRYLVVQTPAWLAAASPGTVVAGQQVTLSGLEFGMPASTNRVLIGGAYDCAIVSWTDTQIVATVPLNATTGYIGVYKQGVASNGIWLGVVPGATPNRRLSR